MSRDENSRAKNATNLITIQKSWWKNLEYFMNDRKYYLKLLQEHMSYWYLRCETFEILRVVFLRITILGHEFFALPRWYLISSAGNLWSESRKLWRRLPWATLTSRSESYTPTSTSTAVLSTKQWASPLTSSLSSLPFLELSAGCLTGNCCIIIMERFFRSWKFWSEWRNHSKTTQGTIEFMKGSFLYTITTI